MAWGEGHDTSLEYHRVLLDDPHRVDAYERALRALVRPGDVVLDLGAGTGLLSMLAARRGAARVHAVESMAVAGLAEQLVAENGLEGVVRVHRADFRRLEVVEPVDLVVSEFMGRWVVDDGMFEAIRAAEPWMGEGARFCPSEVRMELAPVGDFQLWAVDFFDTPLCGLELRSAQRYALNYCYAAQLRTDAVMGEVRRYATLRPPAMPARLDAELTLPITRPGRLQALAGWFEATLAPGVTLSTAPGIGTHWGQYLFPLPPLAVEVGDSVRARLWLEERDPSVGRVVWRWRGGVWRGEEAIARFDQESEQRLGER